MSTVIRIEKLSKRYVLGSIDRQMLYEDLQRRWARLLGKPDPFQAVDDRRSGKGHKHQEIWALRDVDIEVRAGDVVGVIGRNGSGKSTLLKILSKITAPTSGRALIKGRVASLLEVGTGFHGELTGRENVYMNGSILGMTKAEIDRNFDAIVDFSGVEKFIDTPVKRYSSGMMVRLAFAVAAHIDPEILIIDEVLAVGDSAFQQKCLGRMSQVAKEGRTILFVSHQAAAVENLCTRGIVLEGGQVKFTGTQTEAINYYVNSYSNQKGPLRDRTDRTGSGRLRIVSIELRDVQGNPITTATSGQDIDVVMHFENESHQTFPQIIVSLFLKTRFDVPVFSQSNRLTGDSFGPLPASGTFVCRIRRLPLPSSSFILGYLVASQNIGGELLDMIHSAMDLNVEGGDFYGSGELPPVHDGTCLVDAEWRLETGAPSRRSRLSPS